MKIAFLFLLLVFSVLSFAEELSIHFDQTLVQGALVTGKTNAKSLSVDNRNISLDEQGRFVFGLGRNAKANLSIALFSEGGATENRRFQVQQREYETQKINGVAQKYVDPPAHIIERTKKEAQLVAKARETNRDRAYEYLGTAIWPAEGPITGVFGSQRIFNGVPKRPHYGLDIAGPVGEPVIAPLAGKVTFVGDLYYSGGTLIIDHGRGVSSTFIHLDKVHVTNGDYVEQGQLIADIGATGRVTGPHLDWRLNWFNVRLDPELILPRGSDKPDTK